MQVFTVKAGYKFIKQINVDRIVALILLTWDEWQMKSKLRRVKRL